jgi:hypothetical protein
MVPRLVIRWARALKYEQFLRSDHRTMKPPAPSGTEVVRYSSHGATATGNPFTGQDAPAGVGIGARQMAQAHTENERKGDLNTTTGIYPTAYEAFAL